MKLLPKKEIDIRLATEKKIQIDEGMSLAKSVDNLRKTLATEKKNLAEWRESNIKQIQQEIDSYIEVKENLKIATEKAEAHRKELLEPLDKEWEKVNKEKELLAEEKKEIYLSGERLKTEKKEIEKDRQKISEIVSQITKNEKDTEKIKEEINSLKDLAQREYEMAREDRISHSDIYEKTMRRLSDKEKEYEVAMSIIQIRENEVKEKESDIIKREQHLETQQKALRVAREVLKL